MPPLSRGLRNANISWKTARIITQLDFLLPWTLPTARRNRRYSSSDPRADQDGANGAESPYSVEASDLIEKHGESSTNPSTPEVTSSTRSPWRARVEPPSSKPKVQSLSEEVASLSSSLPGLLKPWDDQPPPHLLPGVDLPKLISPTPPDAVPYSLLGLPARPSNKPGDPLYERRKRSRRRISAQTSRRTNLDLPRLAYSPSTSPDPSPHSPPNLTPAASTTAFEPSDRDKRLRGPGILAIAQLSRETWTRRLESLWNEHHLATSDDGSAVGPHGKRRGRRRTMRGRQSLDKASRAPKALDRSLPPVSLATAPDTTIPTHGARTFEAPRPIVIQPTDDVPRYTSSELAWQFATMNKTLDAIQSASETVPDGRSESEETRVMLRRLKTIEQRPRRRAMMSRYGATMSEARRNFKEIRRRRPLPIFQNAQDEYPPPSFDTAFVKRQLLHYEPPTPRAILTHLLLNTEQWIIPNLQTLIRYAERVEDQATASRAREGLPKSLVGRTATSRYRLMLRNRMVRRSYSSVFIKAVERWHRRQLRKSPGVPLDPDQAAKVVEKELSRREGDPHGIDYPERIPSPYWFLSAHPWAEAAVPMSNKLPVDPTIDERLEYLHYVLATADFQEEAWKQWLVSQAESQKTATPTGSTESGQAASSLSPSLEHHSDTWFSHATFRSPFLSSIQEIAQACRKADRRSSGSRQAMLMVLHLYMMYASRMSIYRQPLPVPPGCHTILYERLSQPYLAVWIFEEYARLSHRPAPSRQTLHLIFQDILFGRPSLGPSVKWEDLPPPGKSPVGGFQHPYRLPPPPDPEAAPRLISDVRMILKTFQYRWHIRPGPETIRLLSSYALQVDSVELAKECWDMWWREMSLIRPREPRWEGDYPRWEHRRKHSNSWLDILKPMKSKGWVEMLDEGEIEFSQNESDKSRFARLVAEMAGKEGMARERYLIKRRLRRAAEKEEQVHPDIQRGKDVDGQMWFGFTGQAPRWRWLGRGDLDWSEAAGGDISAGAKSDEPDTWLQRRAAPLELVIGGSAHEDVGQRTHSSSRESRRYKVLGHYNT